MKADSPSAVLAALARILSRSPAEHAVLVLSEYLLDAFSLLGKGGRGPPEGLLNSVGCVT